MAGFILQQVTRMGTLHTEDIRTVRGWSMARAAVDSPADVEEAAVWAESAADKEIAGERTHPKGTGCLSVSNIKLLSYCAALEARPCA